MFLKWLVVWRVNSEFRPRYTGNNIKVANRRREEGETHVPMPKKVVEQTVQKATTSRTGSGSKRGRRRRDSAGAISIASTSPSGNVSNPVPTIRATVKAEGSNLSKSDVRLYLDGAEQRRFYYGRATGNLSYRPTGMLSAGTHTVEVVATGDQGRTTARKRWTFTVT
jgi:hypothetical protein